DFILYLLDFKGENPNNNLYNKEEVDLGDKKASTFLMSSTFFYYIIGVRFSISTSITAIGTISIENPLGQVTYYILDAPTLFLFSLYNANRLEAYFNNVDNIIIQKNSKYIPVI
ncbi:hypothetical protein CCHL11_02499, partial [Colletotrichum chlorophyti]